MLFINNGVIIDGDDVVIFEFLFVGDVMDDCFVRVYIGNIWIGWQVLVIFVIEEV